MKPFGPLIRYRCTNPTHQTTSESLSDTMTIHERSWAFCPYDVRVPDHRWTLENPAAPILVTESAVVREPADLPARG